MQSAKVLGNLNSANTGKKTQNSSPLLLSSSQSSPPCTLPSSSPSSPSHTNIMIIIRAGMELGQVLSVEQRKERFSSSMRRKRAAAQEVEKMIMVVGMEDKIFEENLQSDQPSYTQENAAAAAVESDSSPGEENVVASISSQGNNSPSMNVSTSTSTSPPPMSVSAQSPRETDVREVGNSGNQERWLNMGSSSFSPPRPGISSLPSILNIESRQSNGPFLAALRNHAAIIGAPSIGGAIGGPIVGPLDRPLGRSLGGQLGGQLGGPLGSPPTWSGQARSYPPPSSTFTPTACQTPNYPPWSTLDRSPRQAIDNNYHYRPVMKNITLPTVHPGGCQLSFLPPRENGFDEAPELPKIDVSSRPSVIQAMRSVPSYKSQRISDSLETYERNATNKAERIVIEENLVEEAICDEQETEIIMKYIHKKFSKYIFFIL